MTSHQAVFMLLDTSSNGEVRLAFLLLGPIAAFLFFGYIWRRYRNTDKSYQYESTTRIDLSNVLGSDKRVRHISRTSQRWVEGHDLTSNPRDRIR